MIQAKEYFLPFLRYEQVAKDAYSFYFDRRDSGLELQPGQYMRVTLDIPEPDERGVSRLFSFSSSPLDTDYIRFTTRVIQSSFKKALLTLQTGQKVKFFAPMGQFVFDEEDTRPRIFLAGGIGITPFLSIVSYAAGRNLTTSLTLFVSFSTVEEVVYYDEMVKIAEEHPNIKIVYTVTHPEESQKPWQGETGRISAAMIQKYAPDYAQAQFMISGPPPMVGAMSEIVKEMKVTPESVKQEQFTGY